MDLDCRLYYLILPNRQMGLAPFLLMSWHYIARRSLKVDVSTLCTELTKYCLYSNNGIFSALARLEQF